MIVSRPAPRGRLPLASGFLLLAACATRTVPDHFPQRSALSSEANVPRPAEVTRAFADDPAAFNEPGDAGSTPHAQHGGHHHAH